jgi:hypothetical protein
MRYELHTMDISFVIMSFLGFIIFILTVLFFIAFAIPRYRRSEPFQLISGVIEVIMISNLLGALLILLVLLVPSQVTVTALYGFGGIGIVQLFYVVPRSLALRRQERWARMKGVIIGAVIVALLNGGCWVLFLAQ